MGVCLLFACALRHNLLTSFVCVQVWVLRGLSHPNVLRFIGILYKDKKLIIVTGQQTAVP